MPVVVRVLGMIPKSLSHRLKNQTLMLTVLLKTASLSFISSCESLERNGILMQLNGILNVREFYHQTVYKTFLL